MEYPKDRNLYRPPHVFVDNNKYFIVARTLKGQHFFDNDEKKQILYKSIMDSLEKFDYICDSWVILDNHYQLVIDVKNAKNLSDFIQLINGTSSRFLNLLENCMGRKIWHQYWDAILDSDESYWTHVNYNHHNPVKHGYVAKMKDYKWSDFNEHIEKFGELAVYERFESYPIINFTSPSETMG